MAESLAPSALMAIQLAYATPQHQFLLDLQVAPGTTVMDAIRASGILQQAPEIDLDHVKVGIYGKKKTLDFVLRTHDRIELYRPLIADPKEARRKRARSV